MLARRAVGVVLLALVVAPWYELVGLRSAGPSAEQTLRLGDPYFQAHWAGLGIGALLVVVLSRFLPAVRLASLGSTASRWLLRPPVAWLGIGLGTVAGAVSLWTSVQALNRRPILLDGISQLVQARYFAAGRVAGPALPELEFWQFQFMVQTDAGWVSQYPPGFPALLALAWRSGLPWLAGPLLLGATVGLATLVSERLFPDDRTGARLGAVLMAVSLFLAFHAGAYMNHVLALALVTLAVYASLRSLDGSWRWALLSGGAVGWLFATRPYVGIVLGFFATVMVLAGAPRDVALTRREWVWRLASFLVGAAPFGGAMMAYNAKVFGDPFLFGYVAAAGPAHGLGFHVDPWGSPYGPMEALGYTSADLLGMSLDLLQTPFPAIVVISIYLLGAGRLSPGARLALGWALLPVLANALYWHHDLFMGPRLLYEAAPGWCLLLGVASLWLLRALPERGVAGRWANRTGVAAVFALSLVAGVVVTGPAKLSAYGGLSRRSGMGWEAPRVERPSLVFVHEDWESRLGARLSASGMRLDSLRAALVHNSTCEVEAFVSAREGGKGGPPDAAQLPELDFAGSAGRRFREHRLPSGARIRTHEGEVLSPECERQAASDFAEVLALPPLLWQGDLPGLEARGAMFVRDFGPERNARLLERFPEREPRVLVRGEGGELRLIPYDRGMEEIWTVR